MSEVHEFVVTTKSPEDTGSLLHDLVLEGNDSDSVPARGVEISDLRYINSLNTHYLLTDEEAEALKSDPRVEDVVDPLPLVAEPFAFQEGDFTKAPSSFGSNQNWGLIRHSNATNVYGSSSSTNLTYDYVLGGTGVDIVIIDTGIQPDHPEFRDDNGNSRVKQIDWFAASGVPGSMPSNHYRDVDGHGTHVAAIAAGRTFGWARNSDIYSIKILNDANVINTLTAMDLVLGWHLNKTNGRPTVVNNSWGYIIFNRSSEGVFSFSASGGTVYPINGGVYRGTSWSGATLDINKGHSISTRYSYTVSAIDADVTQLIDAGVFVCNAAVNSSLKNDVPGGVDYNNYITLNGFGSLNYHRGGSPNVRSGKGFQVGAIGTSVTGQNDDKSFFSNSGPNVAVYAAGSSIKSALSVGGSSYYLDTNFHQGVLSGTSMASPQLVGIAALILQAHPDWKPSQVYDYIVNNATAGMNNTNLDNDYSNSSTTHGGPSRVAYLPMSGRKVYNITSE